MAQSLTALIGEIGTEEDTMVLAIDGEEDVF
ncbi:hypothetical protein QE374_000294 [Microbacterium sp. SORGH_AS428]|nr:hypothetical protein [Microbacterium sp. SORGH_AS_0428]